ncbi:hypothetical protein [Paenibacillus mendelii]|uniref:ABC transporter permease n=1 Tax=Paenibacillus mendelii TaxID=206163 RepID=A0ABV6JEX8_9BACL|nr:hypothetical protein [Paenibacillus mendelii]
MYLINKAMKNLLRNKGRNSILFLMLFMVTLAAVASLTIYNTTMEVKEETENYYAGEVSITQVKGKELAVFPTTAEYEAYIRSDYLQSYVFYKSIPATIEGLKVLDGDYEEGENENNGVRRLIQANSHVYGMLDERATDDFTYGDRKVIEGAFPERRNDFQRAG